MLGITLRDKRQPCEDSYVRGRGPASSYVTLGGVTLKQHLTPPEGWLRHRLRPHPQFLLLEVQAGAREGAFPTCSQVMLMPLVWVPH